jgi:hypothetical protein
MNVKELGEEVVYWICLAQDSDKGPAVVNTVVSLLVS